MCNPSDQLVRLTSLPLLTEFKPQNFTFKNTFPVYDLTIEKESSAVTYNIALRF